MTRLGVYRHYKGGLYRAIHVARDSTNGPNENRRFVVYVSLTTGAILVRRETQFHEAVVFEGVTRTRFHYVAADLSEMS